MADAVQAMRKGKEFESRSMKIFLDLRRSVPVPGGIFDDDVF